MNNFTLALKKYAQFNGRSTRTEYWMFVLISLIIYIILSVVDYMLNTNGLISGIYTLAIIVPGFAVATRRLHDINKSAWWLLIGFIPLIGPIIAIVLASTDSQPGDNMYGSNPKGITSAAGTLH